jgi:DNA-binding HxlR family transcriptional regulator
MRKVYPEVPPKVEYSLTPLGESLMPHIMALTHWATENFDHIIEHRARYTGKREQEH